LRTALVTGALGGIGRATVAELARCGWQVFGADRAGGPPPDGCARLFPADLGSPSDVEALFDELDTSVDHLDALINNAAIQLCKPIVETTVDEWDEVMRVNLRAAFLATKRAHGLLSARGGAIVNVSSVHAVATSANIGAYAASKGGLLALTRALAIELAPRIRVNALLPGAVDTPMLRAGIGRAGGATVEEGLAGLADRTVLGRVGMPAEIAQAIVFLADPDRSSFMTGQAVIVDGGATCRLSTE
jgi:glucose 1-dehydrogenase